MKKSVIIASSILVLVVILGVLFFQKNENANLTGKVVFSQPVVLNCTDQSMKTIWDAYFKESSNGITIFKEDQGNGDCQYVAYKIKGTEVFMIYADQYYYSGSMNTLNSEVLHFNLTSQALNSLGLLNTFESLKDFQTDPVNGLFSEENYNLRSSSITSSTLAESEFNNYFKLTSLSLDTEPTTVGDLLCNTCFGYESINFDNQELVKEAVMSDISFDYLVHSQNVPQPCIQNWTAQNTTCVNDRKTTWYNDSNFCENNTGIPLNITLFCDGDSNGIIGNVSSVSTNNFANLKIFINNSELNLSTVYSSIKTVEIRDNATTYVQFNWNFSVPLNLLNMTLKKSSSGSSEGYIIVNGLEINKTVYLDKKGNDTKICIKNSSSVSSTNSFSHYCDDDDETLLTCPETKDGFSCTVENNNTFKVSGLMHSGVMELVNYTTGCTPSWSCSSFGYCVNSVKTRTCTDSNNCNSSSSRPALTQTCNLTDEEQIDNTSVQTNTVLTNTDPIIKTATESSKKINPMVFVYVLVGIFVVIVIGVGIFALQKKKQNTQPTMSDQLKPYLNNSQVPPQNPSNNFSPNNSGTDFPPK